MSQQHTLLRTGLALTLSLIIGGLVACGRQPKEIRIGVIAPFSGEKANIYGQPIEETANLTVQAVNDAGGLDVGGRKHKVVLVFEDNQDKREAAVAAAQKLINQENVVAIVGLPLSRNAIPVANVAENAHLPMISVKSSHPETTAGKQYVFRVVFTDPFQGGVMARFALEELGAQNAAALYDVASAYNTFLAEAFKQAFEEAGGQVVAFETYTTDQNQDFSRQLARIRDSGAEVLFLPNYFNEVTLQVQQARQMGINATFLGGDSWKPEVFADLPEFEGSLFNEIWSPDIVNEQSQAFSRAYHQAYDRDPTITAAITYDAFGLLFQALQSQNQADPESIRNGLVSIGRYTGVTGVMEFRGTGDPVRSAVIMQFKDGEAILYKLVNP